MAQITLITSDGEAVRVEGDSGSVMELAVKHNIKGIDGDCGGVCSCATCHVHVPEAFQTITGTASELELDMLEFDDNYQENSRLSCQIMISEKLDGITLKVAR